MRERERGGGERERGGGRREEGGGRREEGGGRREEGGGRSSIPRQQRKGVSKQRCTQIEVRMAGMKACSD